MRVPRALCMIGNAHIDPVWLWRWTEGREEVLSTCRTALELMDENPDFVYCHSQAATYAWIEEYDPALFDRIRVRVAEGRFAPVGGWWVQPDCNIPSGESLVRQALYGKRYFMERFGVEVQAGYNVDTFGHPATLPQILAGCGLPWYCFFRPGPHERELPGAVFRWQAPDGTAVIACRAPGHYCTGPEEIDARIRECAAGIPEGIGSMLCFYGVGNHGGGPTRANLASIRRLQDDPDLPELVMSDPTPFFRAAEAHVSELPVWARELQYHARGCYTAVSEVKRANREAEQKLVAAERLTSVGVALGLMPSPAAELAAAWKLVLFNQFHDVLAGTSIRPAYDDAREDYAEAMCAANRHLRRVLHRMAALVDTSGDGQPVVVFNPTAEPRREVIETDVAFAHSKGLAHLVDDAGVEVDAFLPEPAVYTRGQLHTVAFTADVPALGYRTYRLRHGMPRIAPPAVEATPRSLESRRFIIEVDPETGWLSRLYDKMAEVEVLAAPGNVPLVIRDDSDTWSHGVDAFRDEVGAFRLAREPEVWRVGGPYGILRLVLSYGESLIEQHVVLYSELDEIAFRTTVDWHERHRMLKVSFPIAVANPVATFEVAYGHVQREPCGDEEPVHRWFDVTGSVRGTQYGAALLNDCKYGCDVLGGEMRLSVLRSPIYAFHDPQVPVESERYEYTDQGRQRLTYVLVPHMGDWREAGVVRRAAALNAPCLCVCEPPHGGRWRAARSFLSHTGRHVCLEVLKCAEDGEGLVLRGYETDGVGEEISIEFLGEDLGSVCFGPHQIRTWRLSQHDGHWRLACADMLERTI